MILQFLFWAALLQGFFLAMLYIFSKRHQSFANFLLGMFLVALILEALTTISPFDHWGDYKVRGYFALPEVKLFIPLLFFHFIVQKIGCSHRYLRFLKVNYGLAFEISTITLFNLYLYIADSSSIVQRYGFENVDRLHFILQCYAFIVSTVVFGLALFETKRIQNIVQNELSDYDLLQIKWLWRLILALFPVILIWAMELLRIGYDWTMTGNFVLPLWCGITLFIYVLSYQAFKYPGFALDLTKNSVGTQSVSNKRYNQETLEDIHNKMVQEEFYLKKDLTLNEFAKNISLSPRVISQYVNTHHQKNFNKWVNGYRVKKACQLIEDDVDNQLSIEGIGLESGFKSRSSFYNAFKNEMGCSPGKFKKIVLGKYEILE